MDMNLSRFYKSAAQKAIDDPILQKALTNVQARMGPGAAAAIQKLPEGPGIRQQAHEIREFAIENLDVLLTSLAQKIRDRGGHVFFAKDADEATQYCLKVAKENRVKQVVKGKSMVTEEIGLNEVLGESGIEVTETDLGEYIVQLAGESPSHIIAPAVHKTRQQVADLFVEKLGIEYTEDPPALTRAARKALREKFLAADMGLSGCNMACAETGHITTVSNEGNIRMSTTLPKIHMAFMGMERVVARLEDHDFIFRLLCRSAAVQNMAGYVSYIGGPRSADQLDGPDQFHLVILDNGRSKILADPDLREVLLCIRCAACLNVCPAYGKIGGHTYGSPYSGPIGAVVTPLLTHINTGRHLIQGEPLCGACKQACPVDINLPRLLLELRAKLAQGDPDWEVTPADAKERFLFRIWSFATGRPALYRMALKWVARLQGMVPNLPGMGAWTRDLPKLAPESFLATIKKRKTP